MGEGGGERESLGNEATLSYLVIFPLFSLLQSSTIQFSMETSASMAPVLCTEAAAWNRNRVN